MKPDQKDARIQCFDQMESPLLHYAYGILRNDDAKDIVQEAFHTVLPSQRRGTQCQGMALPNHSEPMHRCS